MSTKEYRLGNARFKTLEAKEKWILEGALMCIGYIGKETKLSPAEKGCRDSAIKKLKLIIKKKNG